MNFASRESLRTYFPVFYLALTGYVMWHTRGFYRGPDVAIFAFCPVVLVANNLFRRTFPPRGRVLETLSPVLLLFNLHLLVQRPRLMYVTDPRALLALQAALWVALGAGVLLLLPIRRKKSLLILIATLLLIAKALVVVASPKPFIDVFSSNTIAADYVLTGHNPYSQRYPDIYEGKFDYEPAFSYWPGLLAWIAPARWLTGDIRAALWVSDLLTLLLVCWLFRKRSTLGLLLGVTWLAHPVGLYVMEQAWIDPILVALTLAHYVALSSGRWKVAAVIAGHLVSVKQYGLLIPLVTVPYLYGQKQTMRTVAGYAAIAFLASAVFVLPLALIDLRAFYQSTVVIFQTAGVRGDSFSLRNLMAHFHWEQPAGASPLLCVVCGVALTYGFLRRYSDLAQWALALFVSFCVVFLFAKQAFCNYYYYASCFLFIFVIAQAREEALT